MMDADGTCAETNLEDALFLHANIENHRLKYKLTLSENLKE